MPFVSNGPHLCRHCGLERKRVYDPLTGRFKGYIKTCGTEECRSKSHTEARRAQVYKQRICEHCAEKFTPTGARQRWCPICVPHKRARAMMTRYGLSWPGYLMAISDPCPLCGAAATVIDHDHATGKRRSALCGGCNIALNRVEIDGWVGRAMAYVEEHANAV